MKMKLNVLSAKNVEVRKIDMPGQFNEPVRPDLIKRAVKAIESHNRQAYGSDPRAGMRHSSFVSKRRNKYKTTYGIGQSRTPRKVMSSRGTRFNWVGATAPQTVGGRRAHPPKAEKIWSQKINKKENRKAIRSAISAAMIKDLADVRGHKVPDNYPFIVESCIEDISLTKEAIEMLEKIGIAEDLERSAVKKIRAGKGKARGRKYRHRIGPLLVVSEEECAAMKSFSNIPGVDVEVAHKLNARILAPGCVPGRLTIFTEKAVARIGDEKLFTEDVKLKAAEEKKKIKPKKEAKKEEAKPKTAVKPEVKTLKKETQVKEKKNTAKEDIKENKTAKKD